MTAADTRISDGRTAVLPVTTSNILLKTPILIAGFSDSGMIGSITINHVIEQLGMHQIAFIESQYIMPAAIFIGRKFRHAFRIYATDSGKICALICEVPVLSRGIYSIVNTIVDWSTKSGISEVIVLGGVLPVNPGESYPVERRALLFRNESAKAPTGVSSEMQSLDIAVPDNVIIAGMSGSLLSSCASRGIPCTALMMPTISDSADPEGALIILESLPKILPGLKIDTSSLRQKVEDLKKHLQEFMRMHQQQMEEYERGGRETERIYK